MDFSRILEAWEKRAPRDSQIRDKDQELPREPQLPPRTDMEKAPLDDELDLHGLLVDQALGALRNFLRESRQAGYQKVLVIHGKGLHSEHRRSVVKDAVQQALLKDKNVAAWGEAGRRDGGKGASWVWLSGVSVRGK